MPLPAEQPKTYRLRRNERGHLLCPLCKTSTLTMNYQRQGKRFHWFHQCRVCETPFKETNDQP